MSKRNDPSCYFTYRPLSNLPTPPPSSKASLASQSPRTTLEDGEPLQAKFLGPSIHLVNLIPAPASLATASTSLVQAILSRANLPIETVALAVCILDSLDSKFARHWRLSCPLQCFSPAPSPLPSTPNKRHTLPPTPHLMQQQQLHIDSVRPEIIILSALVIAIKFTDDSQEPTHYYKEVWGKSMWTSEQLNVTERCIMENLNYRIMPLCDEDCLADAMVDMQLAAQQLDWQNRELTPPDSATMSEDEFVPGHSRSKTTIGLGFTGTILDASVSRHGQ